jgi:signal transduction histidine kinase
MRRPTTGEIMDRYPEHDGDLEVLRSALRASESRFHNVIEKNADGILVIGPEGGIRYANPAAVRLLRRPLDQLLGKVFGIPIVPGETTEIDLPFSEAETRVAELHVAETAWEGEPAVLATLRDISERKALEAQLRQKVQELAEADRRKDEFLAMLAHELRNPLAPIRNALYIMKARESDPGIVAQTRALIEQGVQSITRLVDDLLDVTRIKTGKLVLRPEPADLSAIIARSLETTRSLVEAKRHQVRLSLPSAPLSLVVDPTRIEQILVNLLTNAAKYTEPGGSIELACEVGDGEIALSVRDNGVGIAPEMLGRIFDLFAQVDDTFDRSLGGLGIGLTLSRRLARLHGGDLTVASEGLGLGSQFILRLPVNQAPPPILAPGALAPIST